VPLYGDGRSGTVSTVPGVYGAYLQSLSGNIHPEIVRLSQVVSQPAVIVIAGTGFGNDPFGAASIAGVVTLIERLIPDAILDMVGLSGSVSLVQDDPDSADANWLVAA
jgi:hypothetical protein